MDLYVKYYRTMPQFEHYQNKKSSSDELLLFLFNQVPKGQLFT
jgi:hypothetical protein